MSELHTLWPKMELPMASHQLCCLGTLPSQRHITVDGIPFSSLEQLVSSYPTLLEQLDLLANIVNFLLVGEHFHVITNVELFKRSYLHNLQKEEERENLHNSYLRHPYGRLDISALLPPHFLEERFIFFTLNTINDLLYSGSCRYPFLDDCLEAKYELLPF